MARPNRITPGLLIGFLVAMAISIAIPYVVSDFVTYQFTLAMAYAVAMLGLNVLTGYNGQFSIGHSAFFAVGAYMAAIMIEHFGLSAGKVLERARGYLHDMAVAQS